jgi:hypothetical protein
MPNAHCRLLSAGLTLSLALFAGGCSDGTVSTAPARTPAAVPAFDQTASSGAAAIIVERGIVGNWWGGDPRDQLALMIGWEASIADVCAANDPLGGPVSPGIGRGVIIPSGKIHFVSLSHEANVVVVQYGAGLLGFDVCPLVGAAVVATGTVKYSSRITLATNGPGQVSHVTAEGIVDLTGGGQARLFATARFVLQSDGSVVIDEQRVRLTPL